MRRVTLLMILLAFTQYSHADIRNFRVGLGWLNVDIQPSPLTPKRDHGVTVFAEYPQNNYTASRFIMYRLDAAGRDRLRGFETQLMWGYGLAQPGIRLYTGPAWHYETWHNQQQEHRFNGWGWQLGGGFQFQAITIDVAATYRHPSDYHRFNRRQGIPHKPDPIFSNLLISYRF